MSQKSPTYTQKSGPKGGHSRVLVGMSGGIHSSVTAALLKTQGHEVVGVYIDAGIPQKLASVKNHCVTGNGRAEAEQSAKKIGVELHIVEAAELYRTQVIDEVVHATARGETPNPCVRCNRVFRIATLLGKADALRCDRVATGHGAQVLHDPRSGLYHLMRASDPQRDQSFALFSLTQKELERLMLPLGNFPGAMVARLGGEYGFSFVENDSQSMCFAPTPEGKSALHGFLESAIAPSLRPRGVIRSQGDEVFGEHLGLFRYRIGESARIDQSVSAEKLVVVGIDTSAQALILGSPDVLQKKGCTATLTNWLRPMNELIGLRCGARLTPQGDAYPCYLTFFENQTVQAEFEEPRAPVFPGQPIVFYLENEVLGGGWIRTTS